MLVKVKMVPRRLRTAASFQAADPWNGGLATRFTVEVYKYVPEHVADASGLNGFGAPERFGLRSSLDGVERMLPEPLIRLWHEQRVGAEQLPLLLHELEPSLVTRDYRPIPRRPGLFAVLGWLATLLVVAGWLMLRGSGLVQPAHGPRSASLAQWLSEPHEPGEVLIVPDLAPVAGLQELLAPIRTPEGATPAPLMVSRRSQPALAWVKDARGHRLVLISPGSYVTRGTLEIGMAPAFTPEQLGLDPQLLAELRGRVPDLDTSSVVCPGFRLGRSPRAGRFVHAGLILALVPAAGCALGFSLALPLVWLRQRRCSEQMQWALRRAGAAA